MKMMINRFEVSKKYMSYTKQAIVLLFVFISAIGNVKSQNYLQKKDSSYLVIKGTNTIYVVTAGFPKEKLVNVLANKRYNLEIKDETWRTPNNIDLGTTGYKIGLFGGIYKKEDGSYWITIKGMIKEGVTPGKELVCENMQGIPMIEGFEHIMGVAESLGGTIFSFGDTEDGFIPVKPKIGK